MRHTGTVATNVAADHVENTIHARSEDDEDVVLPARMLLNHAEMQSIVIFQYFPYVRLDSKEVRVDLY